MRRGRLPRSPSVRLERGSTFLLESEARRATRYVGRRSTLGSFTPAARINQGTRPFHRGQAIVPRCNLIYSDISSEQINGSSNIAITNPRTLRFSIIA